MPPPVADPVGVVDPRTVVRTGLAATLAAVEGLELVAVHADWADVDDPDHVVWVSPTAPRGRAVRRVDAEDLDVADGSALAARVQAARRLPGPGRPATPAPLSPREDAALTAVAAGVPATRTAAELGISTKAVHNARRRAIVKLGAATQVEAVRLAHELRSAGVPLTRGDADA